MLFPPVHPGIGHCIQHLPKSQIVLGVEAYYKTMSDLITYKEVDWFTYYSNWQDLLATNSAMGHLIFGSKASGARQWLGSLHVVGQ